MGLCTEPHRTGLCFHGAVAHTAWDGAGHTHPFLLPAVRLALSIPGAAEVRVLPGQGPSRSLAGGLPLPALSLCASLVPAVLLGAARVMAALVPAVVERRVPALPEPAAFCLAKVGGLTAELDGRASRLGPWACMGYIGV